MVDRSELRLGQHVVVRLCGGETVGAVVDGLCNDWVGVRLDLGRYVIADWEDIEVDDEEVVRTEQGEVLAVKKARDMVSVECDATVEFFAPELREINEEEIRKDIIGGLMWQRDNIKSEGPHDNNLILPGFCLTVGEHLAYLVKQKEQKPASTEDMPYITDEHFYEREPADSFKYKLAEYMTKCCTKKEGPYGYTYGISSESILQMAKEELIKRGELKEQKPVEKQDYSGLNELERAIHRGFLCAGVENVPVGIIKETVQDCLTHLPVEWSEEDEHRRQQAINALDRNGYYVLVDWLKSLRPSWKPSEEQMEMLKCTIDYYGSHTPKELVSLYEQLKKL